MAKIEITRPEPVPPPAEYHITCDAKEAAIIRKALMDACDTYAGNPIGETAEILHTQMIEAGIPIIYRTSIKNFSY